ncbi:crossover junction endodeoxyribonuclease RuvC [Candidatus Gottesmanbacteria bacterium]|nr:crossover junction endodeoxyribonuclease RuvC [Candidatus Gottesmanbacteria bacterium]
MKVLGLDPGLATVGLAIIEENNGNIRLEYSDAITTPAKTPHAKRLSSIYTKILNILDMYKPDVAVLEKLFFNTNVTTAFTVGQARGVIQLALAQKDVDVAEYTPMQVKLSLTGYGHAEKNQIQMMVKQVLKLPEILKPDDVADAAAIALTHCFSYKLEKLKMRGL